MVRSGVGKLIGYARVSTRAQDTDRQIADLLAAGVRRDDLYVDHGVSGAHARRPQFDKALRAVHADDTLIVTTLDRLGRSTSSPSTNPRAGYPSPTANPQGSGHWVPGWCTDGVKRHKGPSPPFTVRP